MYFQGYDAPIASPNFDDSVDKVLRQTSKLEEAAGNALEVVADTMSIFRGLGGLMLAKEIRETPDYHSLSLAGRFVGLAATDVEGQVARFGRWLKQEDEETRHEYKSYLDQITDKILVDSTLKAIAEREERNGHTTYSRTVNAAANLIITRDVVTTADRLVATSQGLDTRAQTSGKVKSMKLFGVIAFALSPPADSTAGRLAAGTGFAHCAKQSVDSGLQLHKSLSKQRIRKATETRLQLEQEFAQLAQSA